MVQIREQEEEPHQQQHHVVSVTQQRNQPSSHTTLNNQTTMNQSSSSSHPPPHSTDSPNSSPSSISSEHTFHGFSPIKESSPIPSPPIQALVPVNRLVRDQQPETVMVTVTKTEPKADTGFAARREIPVVNTAKRGKLVRRVGFVLRFFQLLVCLVSFSVMAADKNRGWALDSFHHYTEFRYSMSVNVIGFAYSGLQGLDLLYQLTTGKKSGSQVRYSFDFASDQILAYLLLSASSSAFTRVDDWISNWGSDEFPAMASASIGVSFVAFIAFALSSLISGYLLCTHKFT